MSDTADAKLRRLRDGLKRFAWNESLAHPLGTLVSVIRAALEDPAPCKRCGGIGVYSPYDRLGVDPIHCPDCKPAPDPDLIWEGEGHLGQDLVTEFWEVVRQRFKAENGTPVTVTIRRREEKASERVWEGEGTTVFAGDDFSPGSVVMRVPTEIGHRRVRYRIEEAEG